MSDTGDTGPDVSTDPHDWHVLDAEVGLEVRQVTEAGTANRWEIRERGGAVTVLTDEEFEQLRAPGPNPGGL